MFHDISNLAIIELTYIEFQEERQAFFSPNIHDSGAKFGRLSHDPHYIVENRMGHLDVSPLKPLYDTALYILYDPFFHRQGRSFGEILAGIVAIF